MTVSGNWMARIETVEVRDMLLANMRLSPIEHAFIREHLHAWSGSFRELVTAAQQHARSVSQ